MKNKILVFLTLVVLFATTTVFAISFSDVAEDYWAISYITDLTEKGVVNGYPNGTFDPEGTISRAEFLKLVIAASLPEGVDINTAPTAMADHWAGQYLFAAETYRVVEPGSITAENIDLPITRREMVMMIGKADTNLRHNSLNSEKSITFTDFDVMDGSELRYLTHSVSEEYLNGYPDGSFGPDNNMTRAESATVIWRYTNKEA